MMWALLFMILAVFSLLCEILSGLLVQGMPPEEIAASDLNPEAYVRNYVLPSWTLQHGQVHEDGSKVTSSQIRSYLRKRHLIITTTRADEWKEQVLYGNMETEGTMVEPAIVLLKMTHQTGSGVILQITDEKVLVSTCAHVVGEENEAIVYFEDGTQAAGKVVGRSPGFDLAFLEVACKDIPYDTRMDLRYVRTDEAAWAQLREDDPVFIIASSGEPAGDYYEGYVQYREIYVPEFECYMVCLKSTPIPGMSGGGIFDREGNLVAMVNGGTASGQVVGLSLPVIIGQWDLIFSKD